MDEMDSMRAMLQTLFDRLSYKQGTTLRRLIHTWAESGKLPPYRLLNNRDRTTVKAHLNDIFKIIDPCNRWGNRRGKVQVLIRFFWPLLAPASPRFPPPNVVVPSPFPLVVDAAPRTEDLNRNPSVDFAEAVEDSLAANSRAIPKERALIPVCFGPPMCLPRHRIWPQTRLRLGMLARHPWWHGNRALHWPPRGPAAMRTYAADHSMRWQIPQRLMLGAVTVLVSVLLVVVMGSGIARAFRGPAVPLHVSQMRILTGLGVAMAGAWAHHHPWLAVTSADGTVRVWASPQATTFRTLTPAFADHANAVTWSPDDLLLAAGDFQGDVAIWDVDSGTILRRLAGVTQQIQSLAWSPDGTLLAAASWDFTVRLWNPATGTLLRTLTDHRDCATAVAWSPDGQWLATGGNDDAIYVYHVPDWAHPRLFLGHLGPIRSLAWSPDGRQLLSTSVDMTARLWDAATGQVVLRLLHDSLLKDGTWGTGRYLGVIVTVAENGHLYLWDARVRGVTRTPLLVQDAAQIERAAQITNGPSDSLGTVAWQGDWLAATSLTSSAIVLWQVSRT